MRCWALEKSFFKKFPELIGEISVYQVDPLEMSGRSPTPRDGNAHAPASTGPGEHTASSTDSFEATDFDFGDECVMELFVSLFSCLVFFPKGSQAECFRVRISVAIG